MTAVLLWLSIPPPLVAEVPMNEQASTIGLLPEFSIRLPSMKDPSIRARDDQKRRDELDMSIDIESLAKSGDVECKELPRLPGIMRHVFERSGRDASRFRVYRTCVVYPPPMVSLPTRRTRAALTMASAASMAPTRPRVSIKPRAIP